MFAYLASQVVQEKKKIRTKPLEGSDNSHNSEQGGVIMTLYVYVLDPWVHEAEISSA